MKRVKYRCKYKPTPYKHFKVTIEDRKSFILILTKECPNQHALNELCEWVNDRNYLRYPDEGQTFSITHIISDNKSILPVHPLVPCLKEVAQVIPKPKRFLPRRKSNPWSMTLEKFPDHWDTKLKSKWQVYKKRALIKDRAFTITYKDFENLLSLNCSFCGEFNIPTIDRIDSKIGYTLENSQPCCYTCNSFKTYFKQADFLTVVAKIARFRNLI